MKDNSFDVSKHNWLITGGCGFIGTNLIAHLLKENKNSNIRVLDNLSVSTTDDLARVCSFTEIDSTHLTSTSSLKGKSSSVELVVGDIKDYDTCLSTSQNIDVTVHLAANTGVGPSIENPRQDMEANVIGTFNLLEAVRQNRVKKFIFASSGAPIGECEPPIHEELAPHPVSPYGASKLAGEAYCSAYFRTFGIETVALRFGNVYGPLSTHKYSVVAKFIKRAMEGKPLEIYGDGTQTRDFIFVDDLIHAITLAVSTENIGGEIFQIATNTETTVVNMVKKLLLVLEDSGFRGVNLRHVDQRPGDVRRNFSDTTKAKNILGWDAKVELLEGLKRTLDWFLILLNHVHS